MKKLVFFLLITLTSLPLKAQFALKGGVSFAKNEASSFVVTGQFYRDLLVASADIFIPTQRPSDIAGAGRIGIGFGGDRFRVAADILAMYQTKNWRCGFGFEGNLRLYGPIGIFARYARTYPISKNIGYDEVLWKRKRSEISLGIVIDVINGRCY